MMLTRFLFTICFSMLFYAGFTQEIGLQLNSLKDEFENDPAAAMAKVKAMGIQQVEMRGTHGLSFPEFIKLLAVNGITVTSFEAGFEKIKNFPQVVADEARSYGAKFIVCSISDPNQTITKELIEKYAEALNHAGKIIARNGLLLCYQPSASEFTPYNKGTHFDYMVEKLDSRFVHFELDVSTVKQSGAEPTALLKKYPSRFVILQLRDMKIGSGKADRESHVALGSGDVGIKAVLETARDLGIRYYFIEDESSRAEKQISKSLAYLKTINARDTAKK